MDNLPEKYVVLIPGQIPMIVGSWKLGEILSIAQYFLNWLNNIPVTFAGDKKEGE